MTLDPEHWEQAKQVYAEASQLPGAERERYLEERCGGDAGLENEVRSLLAFHTASSAFLSSFCMPVSFQPPAMLSESPSALPRATPESGACRSRAARNGC